MRVCLQVFAWGEGGPALGLGDKADRPVPTAVPAFVSAPDQARAAAGCGAAAMAVNARAHRLLP